MAKQKEITRYRSAVTGKYVTERYANKHPKITVKETDKVKPRTKKKK